MDVIDRQAAIAAGYTNEQIDAFARQRGITATPITNQPSASTFPNNCYLFTNF